MFFTADPKDVLDGKITDVYFERTLRVLKAKGINPVVKAEFIAKGLPDAWPWALFTGIDEAAYLLKHLKIRVRAMREGTVFFPYEPVMEIEGRYQDFCVYETAILGLICQASGIATKAARVKKLAGDRVVMSFGARRMHPILAPMIERNAFVGGCDGVAVVKSGELIGEDPMVHDAARADPVLRLDRRGAQGLRRGAGARVQACGADRHVPGREVRDAERGAGPIEERDTRKLVQVEDQIDNLKTEHEHAIHEFDSSVVDTKRTGPSPEQQVIFETWMDANLWYQKNAALTQLADNLAKSMVEKAAASGTRVEYGKLLNQVAREVRENNPEYFSSNRQTKTGGVDGGSRGSKRPGNSGGRYSLNSIPEEERTIARTILQSTRLTEEQYVKQYMEAKRG